MAENDPNPNPSESDRESPGGDKGGTGGEGGEGGTTDAEKFASEREKLEAEARSLQSDRDKARKELADAKAELEKAKSGASDEETQTASGLSEDDVRRVMRRESARSRELADAVTAAKKDYPDAAPSVFSDLDSYESASDLIEAAKASHQGFEAHIESRVKEREEELRKRYEAVHGALPAPPENPGSDATGDPTLAQLNAMSMDELDAVEKRSPGVIERVRRSQDQLAK